ncbi:MAG: HepT-like ribonuclease domain-containing protein [Thermomicrobiales bacterium]
MPTLRAFVGLRNRIAHGYATVDHEIVWDTINVDIPDLARSIDDLL